MSEASSSNVKLHEPLLNLRRPWDEEYTHNNGRGRAALTAFLLGIGAGAALLPLVIFPAATPFFAYLILLICFHFSEYALTAAFRPDTLSFDNFLLNHSPAYQVSARSPLRPVTPPAASVTRRLRTAPSHDRPPVHLADRPPALRPPFPPPFSRAPLLGWPLR